MNKSELIKEILKPEPLATELLSSFSSLVDPSLGIVQFFGKEKYYFPDEPNIIAYRAVINPTDNISDGGYTTIKAEGGRGLTEEKAKVSALFEAIERYCTSIYKENDLIYASSNELIKSGKNVVSLSDLTSYSRNLDNLNDEKLMWTTGFSLNKCEEIFIPAQCIYLPYKFIEKEPYLREPLTTGAAAGLSLGKSVLRGILEVIERDVTMLAHYRKIVCPKIPYYKMSSYIQNYVKYLMRYNLSINIYDFSLNYPIPVIVCMIEDSTGIGPYYTFGAKASFDFEDAILGAILEALTLRLGIRSINKKAREEALGVINDYQKLDTPIKRSFLWAQPEMKGKLEYLETELTEDYNKFDSFGGLTKKNLEELLNYLIDAGKDIIVKDVTTLDIKKFGAKVTRTVIPGLQSMHLHEPKLSFTKRLLNFNNIKLNVNKLNNYPHPFG